MLKVLTAVLVLVLVGCGGSPTSFESPAPSDSGPVVTTDAGAPATDAVAPPNDSGTETDASDAATEVDADAGEDAGDVAACVSAACAAAANQTHPTYGGEACGTLPNTTLCGGLPVDCGTCPQVGETCGDDGTTPNQCGFVCSDIYQQDCSQHNSQFPGDPVPITNAYDGTCGAQPWLSKMGCKFITTPAGASRVCCS